MERGQERSSLCGKKKRKKQEAGERKGRERRKKIAVLSRGEKAAERRVSQRRRRRKKTREGGAYKRPCVESKEEACTKKGEKRGGGESEVALATPCLPLRRNRGKRAAGRKSRYHLFMRSEMIPELVCVCVCCIWIKTCPTVCQWGRDLGLRVPASKMPHQPSGRCYFLTSHRFSFRFAYLSDSVQSSPALSYSSSFPLLFLVIGAGRGEGRAERIESNFVCR